MNDIIGKLKADGIEMELYKESDRVYAIDITFTDDEDVELKLYETQHDA